MKPFDFDAVSRNYYSEEQIAKIKRAAIGIAGAGGLGSNCALYLARAGFCRFAIADFDVVEASNLNRQAYFADQIGMPKVEALAENLRRVNPQLEIKTFQIKLANNNLASVFGECDVVVEAFDDPDDKAMLAEALALGDKLLVSVSGIGGVGDSDRIVTRGVSDNFYVIGDQRSGVGGAVKPYAPRVAVAASKQADVVLQWVLNRKN